MLAIVTPSWDSYSQRRVYDVSVVDDLRRNVANHVERSTFAVFASVDRAFRCAAAWDREIRRGASVRHASIIARAEANSDGLFSDDDACAAIEAADLAAGGA